MDFRVTFEVTAPVNCTLEEVEEWLRFVLGAYGSIRNSNPLANFDLAAKRVIVDVN